MFNSPYDTTSASFYKLADIKKDLRDAKIDNLLVNAKTPIIGIGVPGQAGTLPVTNSDNLWYVVAGLNTEGLIPTFFHPLVFKDSLGRDNIAVNLRESVAKKETGELHVRNRNGVNDAAQSLIRMKAVWAWMKGDNEEMLNLSYLPMRVYSRWIAEPISRRLSLDNVMTMRLTVLTSYLYLCLFAKDEDIKSDFVVNCMNRIAIQNRIDRKIVMDVLETAPVIKDIRSFCDHAAELVGAEELKMLTPKLMIQVCSNAWIGANAQESSAIAIEYPPYFMSILYGTLGNRFYKNTVIGTIADRPGLKDLGPSFCAAFTNHINK